MANNERRRGPQIVNNGISIIWRIDKGMFYVAGGFTYTSCIGTRFEDTAVASVSCWPYRTWTPEIRKYNHDEKCTYTLYTTGTIRMCVSLIV